MEFEPLIDGLPALAVDRDRLVQLFGRADLLNLWIAEPYVDVAPAIVETLQQRASRGWYGYETRPLSAVEAFWGWMDRRHHWPGDSLLTSVSPSIGTSIGAVIDIVTDRGDSVILQPPVFTDFKPLVSKAGRNVVRNPLIRMPSGYTMDLDLLSNQAALPDTRLLILCNPHNPVGRAWSAAELTQVARICGEHNVFVLVDEVHADLMLGDNRFVPFASVVEGSGVRWAATHGPIKTFGLSGVADTLLISDDEAITAAYRALSSRLHLTRNNVFGIPAMTVAYERGDAWLDGFLSLVAANLKLLREGLPAGIRLVEPEATFLAWLDFTSLKLNAPELVGRLVDAGLALSPGHWFGREGAGYARMTVATRTVMIERAVELLADVTD